MINILITQNDIKSFVHPYWHNFVYKISTLSNFIVYEDNTSSNDWDSTILSLLLSKNKNIIFAKSPSAIPEDTFHFNFSYSLINSENLINIGFVNFSDDIDKKIIFFKNNRFRFFYSSILPDELTLENANYDYFLKNYIFLPPIKSNSQEEIHERSIVLQRDNYSNFKGFSHEFKIISQDDQISHLFFINVVAYNVSGSSLSHLILNSQNLTYLSEKRDYSFLRYCFNSETFHDDFTKSNIPSKSLRSFYKSTQLAHSINLNQNSFISYLIDSLNFNKHCACLMNSLKDDNLHKSSVRCSSFDNNLLAFKHIRNKKLLGISPLSEPFYFDLLKKDYSDVVSEDCHKSIKTFISLIYISDIKDFYFLNFLKLFGNNLVESFDYLLKVSSDFKKLLQIEARTHNLELILTRKFIKVSIYSYLKNKQYISKDLFSLLENSYFYNRDNYTTGAYCSSTYVILLIFAHKSSELEKLIIECSDMNEKNIMIITACNCYLLLDDLKKFKIIFSMYSHVTNQYNRDYVWISALMFNLINGSKNDSFYKIIEHYKSKKANTEFWLVDIISYNLLKYFSHLDLFPNFISFFTQNNCGISLPLLNQNCLIKDSTEIKMFFNILNSSINPLISTD